MMEGSQPNDVKPKMRERQLRSVNWQRALSKKGVKETCKTNAWCVPSFCSVTSLVLHSCLLALAAIIFGCVSAVRSC